MQKNNTDFDINSNRRDIIDGNIIIKKSFDEVYEESLIQNTFGPYRELILVVAMVLIAMAIMVLIFLLFLFIDKYLDIYKWKKKNSSDFKKYLKSTDLDIDEILLYSKKPYRLPFPLSESYNGSKVKSPPFDSNIIAVLVLSSLVIFCLSGVISILYLFYSL